MSDDTDVALFEMLVAKGGRPLTAYFTFRNQFTADECASLIQAADDGSLPEPPHEQQQSLYNSPEYGGGGSHVRWIPQTREWKWLYDRVLTMAVAANEEWQFSLMGVKERIQVEVHTGGSPLSSQTSRSSASKKPATISNGGANDAHLDIGSGVDSFRKISVHVHLSAAADYDGGKLVFATGPNDRVAPNDQGSVVLFPSYFSNKVTRVTRGRRYTLVMYVNGEPFR